MFGEKRNHAGFVHENRIQRDHLEKFHIWADIIKIDVT